MKWTRRDLKARRRKLLDCNIVDNFDQRVHEHQQMIKMQNELEKRLKQNRKDVEEIAYSRDVTIK